MFTDYTSSQPAHCVRQNVHRLCAAHNDNAVSAL